MSLAPLATAVRSPNTKRSPLSCRRPSRPCQHCQPAHWRWRWWWIRWRIRRWPGRLRRWPGWLRRWRIRPAGLCVPLPPPSFLPTLVPRIRTIPPPRLAPRSFLVSFVPRLEISVSDSSFSLSSRRWPGRLRRWRLRPGPGRIRRLRPAAAGLRPAAAGWRLRRCRCRVVRPAAGRMCVPSPSPSLLFYPLSPLSVFSCSPVSRWCRWMGSCATVGFYDENLDSLARLAAFRKRRHDPVLPTSLPSLRATHARLPSPRPLHCAFVSDRDSESGFFPLFLACLSRVGRWKLRYWCSVRRPGPGWLYVLIPLPPLPYLSLSLSLLSPFPRPSFLRSSFPFPLDAGALSLSLSLSVGIVVVQSKQQQRADTGRKNLGGVEPPSTVLLTFLLRILQTPVLSSRAARAATAADVSHKPRRVRSRVEY